jgi:hypothetical protein
MRRLVAVIGLVILAAGCAGSRHVGPPPNPPELPHGMRGPPAAWVETSAGARWLAYSTFCWPDAGCADYALAACSGPKRAPLLRVGDDEPIRFHLGFEPKRVLLHLYYGGFVDGPLVQPLETSRTPTLHTVRAEKLLLTALAKAGGGEGYVACLRVTPMP